MLRRADSLATSAGALKLTADLVFTVFVMSLVARYGLFAGDNPGAPTPPLLTTLAIAVPALLLCTEIMPGTIARNAP